jgi:hypothetical protein
MSDIIDEVPPILISVSVGSEFVERSLSDDLKTDEDHINVTLLKSPGITAYWNSLYEKQKSVVNKIELGLKRYGATLDKQIRQELKHKDEKFTNGEVVALISLDADYMKLEDLHLEEKETELILKACVEAVKEHRSMLISLSANLRQEGSLGFKSLKNKEEQLRQLTKRS